MNYELMDWLQILMKYYTKIKISLAIRNKVLIN